MKGAEFMKKHLIKLIFAALTFGTLVSFNAFATEPESETAAETETSAGNSLELTASGNISLDAQQEGITAFKVTVNVDAPENSTVQFKASEKNTARITEYRFDEEESIMNIYVADSKQVAGKSESFNIGSVVATDESGKRVPVTLSAETDAVQLVSQNSLVTDTKFKVEDKEDRDVRYLEVKRTFPDSYMVTIPDKTYDISNDENFTVSADKVLIGYGQKLKVSVSSINNWHLMDRNTANTKGVQYKLVCADGLTVPKNTETVLTVNGGEDSGTAVLTVELIGSLDVAGTFADTLTFEIDVS